jgi:hypothetical protein
VLFAIDVAPGKHQGLWRHGKKLIFKIKNHLIFNDWLSRLKLNLAM